MLLHRLTARPALTAATATTLACVLIVSGCEHARTAPRDTARVTQGPDTTTPAPSGETSTWASDIGPALLVQGATSDEAIVLGPLDADSLVSVLRSLAAEHPAVQLFGRGGTKILAQLGAPSDKQEEDCTTWLVQEPNGAPGTVQGWSIGFLNKSVQPVSLDSVDILSSRDSMTLVAEATRLASGVTAPSGPAFQGLRFTVHDIRRFEAAPGVQALAAHLIRHVNQEANPQEEQTLLIAERDSGATTGAYHLVYSERTSGLEDQVTTPEVIGASLVDGRVWLVVARDNDSGISYVIVERQPGHPAPGQWHVRWVSKPTNCS